MVEWVNAELHAVLEIVIKLAGQQHFQVLPKRRVIERTFVCISPNRRIAREGLTSSIEALINITMICLGLRPLSRT